MRLIRIWLSLASIVLIGSACSDRTTEVVEGPIFQDLLSDRTGVTFENRLSPDVSSKFNLLDFDFYYNGSGIGIGDFNQDGLQDIFFAANEGPNELYINDGDFKFSNVSETANINADKFWASGVSIVDINEDGYPDIYISQGGPHEIDERGNVLLINNRDLTFTNQAEQYGLADQGISTQSAFFDYDQDGDLDCIVMNESLFYGYDPVTFHRLLLENPKLAYESYTHLYRNDGGQYQDVTRDAGISAATFGLGLCISDINEDGWLDIYIANDYYQPDNVYINRKDGTFADRAKVHLNHTSFYGMGVDIADINADGHEDILVLDMASKDHVRAKTLMASMDVQSFDLLVGAFGFVHQYMFNSLQLNDGKSRYKNVAQLANIASTDWSWAGLIQDYDLDGNHDILVTNGYRKYGTDNDFKNSVSEAKKAYKGQVPLSVKQELYDRMPSERISNLLFLQNGDFTFEERGASNGLSTPTFSNGAATADLDNDGDLDIVISNIDGPAQILNNTSVDRGARSVTVLIEESGETGAIVELVTSAGVRRSQVKSVRGYLSSVQPVAQFGLSIEEDPVSVSVSWPDGSIAEFNNVRQGARIEVSQKDALRSAEKKSKKNPVRIPDRFSPLSPIAFGIDFQHEENGFNDFETEVLLPYKQSSLKTALLASDLNGDSKDDLLFGGALGQPTRIYMSDGDTYQTIIMDDSSIETVAATTLDIDGDGDQDLILLAGGNESPDLDSYYQHRLYLNEGGTFIQDHTGLPDVRGVGGSVVSFDYDGDGDEDLMIGHRMRPQQYPVHGASIIFENDEGILRDVTATVMPDLMDLGIINDIDAIDLDLDGDLDLVIASEWNLPMIYVNEQGQFQKKKVSDLEMYRGMYFSTTVTDLNADARPDLIFGNIGTNYKLHPSVDKPLYVYAGDMDQNGTHDLVLSKSYKGKYVPVRGKECSTEQMPFISKKFTSYQDYAKSTISDIYNQDALKAAYMRDITTLESIVLVAREDGGYNISSLPTEAQAFPMLDAVSVDVNGDGYEDLIAAGTIYDTEVETPRLDAGTGLVLISNQRDGYVTSTSDAERIYASGEVKQMALVNQNTPTPQLVISRNNAAPAMYQIRAEGS